MRMTLDAELTYLGRIVDTSPSSFGELRSSNDVLQDPVALNGRMAEDGYLFLPGLLNREEVLAAREEILKRLLCYAACASALYSSSDRAGSSTQSV